MPRRGRRCRACSTSFSASRRGWPVSCARKVAGVSETTPTCSSLELLGFFLSLMQEPADFASLLMLACPSCRGKCGSSSEMNLVLRFLVLTQRVDVEAVASLDQEQLVTLLGTSDGCRSSLGVPLGVMECCPYGEAHVTLQIALHTAPQGRQRTLRPWLRWSYTPLAVLQFAAIAGAAQRYRNAFSKYEDDRLGNWQQANVSNTRRATARSKLGKAVSVPQLSATENALLAHYSRDSTWAEELLKAIVPEAVTQPWHRNSQDLHSRIRSMYAHVLANVEKGGVFTAALLPSAPYVRSPVSTPFRVDCADVAASTQLFAQLKLAQHVAESLKGTGGCSCVRRTSRARTTSAASLLMEGHLPYLEMLRRCREESYLVQPEEEGAGTSFYAAASLARFQATADIAFSMSAAQVVNYVAHTTAAAADEPSTTLVPQSHISATLKRHQLDNVQRMWGMECDGVREHVSVPLYHVVLSGASAAVQQVGVVRLCAATNELVLARGPAGAEAQLIRGGLLCYDVGLGKTLSVLALCACERAACESGDLAAAAAATDAEVAAAARKQ